MATDKGIMFTNSPFYIHETGSAGFTSTIELRIWSGDALSEPTDPDILLQKQALTNSSSFAVFEIGQIVNSYIENRFGTYDGDSGSNEDAKWVSVKSISGTVNRDDLYLSTNGYSEFLEGINFNPIPNILISQNVLYHYEDTPIRIPVYVNGTDNVVKLEFKKDTSVIHTEDLTDYVGSTLSYDRVQYVSYDGSLPGEINNLVIRDGSNDILTTLPIKQVDCTKYNPYVVTFVNRYGVNQEIVFDLVSKETIQVMKSTYTKNLLTYSGGVPSYDTTKHQSKDYNTMGKKSIILNTGYVDETVNDTMEQLLQSDTVWITQNGVTSPVNVKTTSLQLKTGINDGLINYTLEFDYSYNTRNNIF